MVDEQLPEKLQAVDILVQSGARSRGFAFVLDVTIGEIKEHLLTNWPDVCLLLLLLAVLCAWKGIWTPNR
jgi:hypothetical protein